MKKLMFAAAMAAAIVLAMSAPAGAERAAKNQGVGVCLSQLALSESGLGDLSSGLGSETPEVLDGARNACGEPPGPGHLG